MSGGCDWQKKKFKVFMGNGKVNEDDLFGKGCDNCKYKGCERCDHCHHWSEFEKKEIKE